MPVFGLCWRIQSGASKFETYLQLQNYTQRIKYSTHTCTRRVCVSVWAQASCARQLVRDQTSDNSFKIYFSVIDRRKRLHLCLTTKWTVQSNDAFKGKKASVMVFFFLVSDISDSAGGGRRHSNHPTHPKLLTRHKKSITLAIKCSMLYVQLVIKMDMYECTVLYSTCCTYCTTEAQNAQNIACSHNKPSSL
jgi:hypothetical protein